MRNKLRIMQTTQRRIIAIMVLFSFFSLYLIYNIFYLAFIKHDYYVEKTYDQITTTSTLKAERGEIYDANMNLLATNKTSWRIFVSPKDIRLAEKNSTRQIAVEIAHGLSSILGLDETSRVLFFSTEGATDKENYRRIVWDGAYRA